MRAIDLFCGAGGSSWGARRAGVTVVAGIDAWAVATEAYQRNFPAADVRTTRLEDVDPASFKTNRRSVDLLLASPECTNHSPAKGNKPRCEASKATALEVVRFAAALTPRWIVVENVANMRRWSRYTEFLEHLRKLGYHVSEQILNAVDFGVPQRRRRLFILCDLQRAPGHVRPPARPAPPASSFVDLNGIYACSPLHSERRSPATLARAARAVEAVGPREPFLLVYYGTDGAGGWQALNAPLRTVTTLDRFALVKPSSNGPVMRMLQVPELKSAMGIPAKFSLGRATRRDSIRLLGNGVCPPVMRTVVRTLVGAD